MTVTRMPIAALNAIRLERATIRRQISVGPMFVSWRRCAAAISDPPQALHTAPIGTVLRWCYRMEERQLRLLLAATGIQSELRQVGELTRRQRTVLADALRAFWEDQ